MSYKLIPRLFSFDKQPKFNQPLFLFAATWALLLFVPLLRIFPQLEGGMLFWRVELAASVLLLIILLSAIRRASFQTAFPHIQNNEFIFLILPCAAFAVVSGVSAFWAESASFALHHTLVWAIYLIFYFLIRAVVQEKQLLSFTFAPLIFVVWLISFPAVTEYFFVYNAQWTTLGLRFSRYAEIFNVLLPIVLVLALYARDKLKFWIFSSTVVLMWLLIITSMSRGSLLLLIFGSVLFGAWCFLFNRSSKIKRRMIGFSVAFVAVITVALALQALTGNLTTVGRAVAANTKESTGVRPFFAAIAFEMLKDKPLQGIGADNFGLEFNRYREIYSTANPDDPNLWIAEDVVAERAHNEYLQILSELGLPGGALFLCFLSGVAFLYVKAFRRRKKLSLLTVAALTGMLLFLLSSLVSSYSFRLMQNGLVFFFVLAIAAKDLFADEKTPEKTLSGKFSPLFSKSLCAAGAIICLALGAHSLIPAAGLYYLEEAKRQKTIEDSNFFFDKAKTLDTENGLAYLYCGFRFLHAERPSEAVPQFRKTVEKGIATTAAYSYLATAQTLAGDTASAEQTMFEAVRIYPHSIFARMRYAALLERNGKTREAENQKAFALQINPPQARSWYLLITEGARVNTLTAFRNEDFVTSMDLKPTNALYAILDERGLVNPEEKLQIDFGN